MSGRLRVFWWACVLSWLIAAVSTGLNVGLEPWTVEEWQRVLVVCGVGLLILKPHNLNPFGDA